MSGLDLNMYLQYTGMDLDTLRKQMRPQAERQVKTRLALEKIAELEKIEVTDEGLEAEVARIAEDNKITKEQVEEFVGLEAVRGDMKVQKALDLVVSKAVVTDKAPEAEVAEEKPAKKAPAKKTTAKKTTKKAEAEAEKPADAE
jgi:trigger factor